MSTKSTIVYADRLHIFRGLEDNTIHIEVEKLPLRGISVAIYNGVAFADITITENELAEMRHQMLRECGGG